MCRSIFMYLKAGGGEDEGGEGEEKRRKGCKKEMKTMKWKEGARWRKMRK